MTVKLTEKAAKKVEELIDEPKERDRIFNSHGVKVYIDPQSYVYVIGTVVDWKESLMNTGFEIHNPNQQGGCGCGGSFYI